MGKKEHRARKVLQRAQREDNVRELYFGARLTVTEIAGQLNMPQRTVYADLQRMKQRWLEQASEDVRQMLARELEKLEYLDGVAAQHLNISHDASIKVRWFEQRLAVHDRIMRLVGGNQSTATTAVQNNTTNIMVVNLQSMPQDERDKYINELLAQRDRCLAREKRGRSVVAGLPSGDSAGD